MILEPQDQELATGLTSPVDKDTTSRKRKIIIGVCIALAVITGIGFYMVSQLDSLNAVGIPVLPTPQLSIDTTRVKTSLIDQFEGQIRDKVLSSGSQNEVITPTFTNIYDKAAQQRSNAQVSQPDSTPLSGKPLTVDEQQAIARTQNTASTTTTSYPQPRTYSRSSGGYSQRENRKKKESSFFANTISSESDRDNSEDAGNKADVEPEVEQLIPAVVNGNQKVRSGQRVTFRLMEDCFINGKHLSKNAIVTATAFLGSDRVTFKVSSVRQNGAILPLKKLKCFDTDMLEGLAYVSDDAIKRGLKRGGRSSAGDIANEGLSALPYTTGGRIGQGVGRGVISALTQGSQQKSDTEIVLPDGHKVFFMPSEY